MTADEKKSFQHALNQPRTARELARISHCSIPTVYRRIEALRASGSSVALISGESKTTGPVPSRYLIVKK